MSDNFIVYGLLIFGCFIIVFLAYKLFSSSSDKGEGYKKKKLLTDNEFDFFQRLVRAAPNCYVCPQVSMGALLDSYSNDYEKEKHMRYNFGYKIVDFVLYNNNKEVVAIIELDDRTHDKEKDYKRDLMLREAGYKILRFESKKKPRVDQLSKIILSL